MAQQSGNKRPAGRARACFLLPRPSMVKPAARCAAIDRLGRRKRLPLTTGRPDIVQTARFHISSGQDGSTRNRERGAQRRANRRRADVFWTWRRSSGQEHPRGFYVADRRTSVPTHVVRLRQLPTNHNHVRSARLVRVTAVYQSDSPSSALRFQDPNTSSVLIGRRWPHVA